MSRLQLKVIAIFLDIVGIVLGLTILFVAAFGGPEIIPILGYATIALSVISFLCVLMNKIKIAFVFIFLPIPLIWFGVIYGS